MAELVAGAAPFAPGSTDSEELGPARPSLPARLLHDRAAAAGLALLGLFVALALAAPLVASADPNAVDALRRLDPASPAHPLGTDNLGRDTLSRLLHGARVSLGLTGAATLGVAFLGTAVGALAGHFGGWADDLLMRLAEVMLALPGLVVALAIVGTLGPGAVNLLLAFLVVSWAGYARVVRGLTLAARERPFVEAARALGEPELGVLARHVLPTVLPSVVVLASVDAARILLALSGLSFLGLGVPAPTAEWGMMLNEARPYLDRAPQLMLYPGAALAATALALNLVGDGLRDALDPRSRGR